MQCHKCMVDFKRFSPQDIEQRFNDIGKKKFAEGLCVPKPAPLSPPLPKEVEEALAVVRDILAGWSFHAGFPSAAGLAALAVLREAVKPRVAGEDAK